MKSFEEALEIVLGSSPLIGSERINFRDAMGRVLHEDINSDMDLPPFNKSAMDGFACRREDLGKDLEILEVIPAGTVPSVAISEGQCSKIMTGAMVPEGADVVIKVEETTTTDSGKVRFTEKQTKSNIINRAEDIQQGERILSKGLTIKPQHIAVLATVGAVKPLVAKRVHVGILSTGDEIVEPDQVPDNSKIRNSNAYQLIAQVERVGAIAYYYGIAEDDEGKSFEMIQTALSENDMVLLTGGVSMGDFDFIPKVLNSLGVEILFQQVAIQPGKPTVYGIHQDKRVFGLPGNPVSSFNTFELFVKPLLHKMTGTAFEAKVISLPLARDYKRKRSSRMSWIPVKINEEQQVYPLEYHGSAHIHALVEADGIINIPVGVTELAKGDIVDVRFV